MKNDEFAKAKNIILKASLERDVLELEYLIQQHGINFKYSQFSPRNTS